MATSWDDCEWDVDTYTGWDPYIDGVYNGLNISECQSWQGDDESKKPEPMVELAEYLIQHRTDDLLWGDNLTFDVDINENALLGILLLETKEKFRLILRDAVVAAHINLMLDRNSVLEKDTLSKKIKHKLTINLKVPITHKLEELNAAEHEDTVVTFEAQISNWAKMRSVTLLAQYDCPECEQTIRHMFTPRFKPYCPQHTKTAMDFTRSIESESVRRVTFRQITSIFVKHRLPATISGDVYGKTAHDIELGDKVVVTGLFRSIPLLKENGKISQEFLPTIQVISIQNSESDIIEMPDMELIKKFKDLEDEGRLVDAVIDGFAYNIWRKRFEKKAVICSLIGSKWIGNRGIGNAPMIHILFVGDPETYKSSIMKYIIRVTDNAILADATTVSNAGIKAIAVKMDDGKYTITAGLLPLFNGGVVFLDEFGDMKSDIYADLKAPMIDGWVTKNVAGENFSGSAETGVLASMNPVDDVYSEHKTILENLQPLTKALITRFDIIFKFSKKSEDYNFEEQSKLFDICDHSGKPENLLTDREIKLFLNYVRTIDPEITQEALKTSTEYFNELAKRSESEDSTRTKNAVMKFAVALARWHMSTKVHPRHVFEALELVGASLKTFGMKLESGEMISEGRLRKSHDGRMLAIQKAWDELKDADGCVFEDEVVKRAMELGAFTNEAQIKALIGAMSMDGRVANVNHMLKFNWK